MKLIDKDALVKEIEKLKAEAFQKKSQCKRSGLEKIMHQIGVYNKILSFINTLEVKEVDLDELVDEAFDKYSYVDGYGQLAASFNRAELYSFIKKIARKEE